MTEFIPPISERENEELIEIANCKDEDIWQKEASLQAQKELAKRNISQEEQDRVIESWHKKANELLKNEKKRLEKNKTESYTIWEMIIIFIFGPIRFFHRFDEVFTLRKENYYLKFKQRIVILILGFITWFIFIYVSIHYDEQKRLQEIEKVDISDWKKKYGYE